MTTQTSSNADASLDAPARLNPLDEALALTGIAVPTYYRWIKVGKVEDRRLRGPRRKAYLDADALASLRAMATHVDVVPEDVEPAASCGARANGLKALRPLFVAALLLLSALGARADVTRRHPRLAVSPWR